MDLTRWPTSGGLWDLKKAISMSNTCCYNHKLSPMLTLMAENIQSSSIYNFNIKMIKKVFVIFAQNVGNASNFKIQLRFRSPNFSPSRHQELQACYFGHPIVFTICYNFSSFHPRIMLDRFFAIQYWAIPFVLS